jgi:acetylornithine deacetylase
MSYTYDIATPLGLLRQLIATQSFSTEEDKTADILEEACRLKTLSKSVKRPDQIRFDNNVVLIDPEMDESRPTLLLCSHHDTVKPNAGYTRDPFEATIEGDTLYGLGSNDAGGCLVALLETFYALIQIPNRNHNVIFAAVAEEENSGTRGIRSILQKLPDIDLAVIGEPTELQLAIAEKGLLVIDGVVTGKSGHAAHENTVNPIAGAVADVEVLMSYSFEKLSPKLGEVRVSVTQINAGTQHNVVPAECEYVIDVRVNECYTNEQVLTTLQGVAVNSKLTARSLRHQSSSIPEDHPLVQAGKSLQASTYGSPTLSDQAALVCPSIKCGPGDSRRSHQADEYLLVSELEAGITFYTTWLTQFLSA